MNEVTYLHLLSLVTPLIVKTNTNMREAISPPERLAATLRFLTTGRSYADLKYSTIISLLSSNIFTTISYEEYCFHAELFVKSWYFFQMRVMSFRINELHTKIFSFFRM